ncbi:hypothetical protein [Aminobacterium sp. UBA4987]|uniref:hypothetical protein n=1 Tax=Aminobacterium sp. UBA4987 TaxID=1946027 RepID=UPI0025807F98|nr:hypothetical protein [Aminobacterium sp. UBA4987]
MTESLYFVKSLDTPCVKEVYRKREDVKSSIGMEAFHNTIPSVTPTNPPATVATKSNHSGVPWP